MRAHATALLAVAAVVFVLRLAGPFVNQATVALILLLPVLLAAAGAPTRWRRDRHPAVERIAMRLFVLFTCLLLAPLPVLAQEPPREPPAASDPADATDDEAWKAITFGATLEAYYQWNGNRPPDRVTQLRAYDTRGNTFAIQQATVLAELAPDAVAGRRFGMRLDLQFGQATEALQGSGLNEPRPDVYRHIWQAYGTYVWPVGRGLRTDVGKFASMLGYESNYAKDDDHFSRAFLFNFLPYYHSGVRASLPVADRLTLYYVLTNGIQQTEEFNDFKSHHVAAVLAPARGLNWTVNYYRGQEQPDGGAPGGPDGVFSVFDSNAAWTPSSRALLAVDVSRTSNAITRDGLARTLVGVGAYGRYRPAPRATVAVRYEWLDDEGLFAGIDQTLQEVTATAEWRFAEGFLVRGEYRRDWSDVAYFPGPDGVGDLRRAQNTATIGLVWWVGSRKGAW